MPFHGELSISDVIQGAGAIASAVTGNPLPAVVGGILSGAITGNLSSVQGITAAQQGALSGGFGGPVTSTGTSVGPNVVFAQPVEAGFGGLIPRVAAAATGSAIGTAVATQFLGDRVALPAPPPAGGKVPTQRQAILAQARFFQPGATAKKIIRAARECGIEIAAQTFGLNVLMVCFLISQPPTRRGGGISKADVRTTRRTIRRVDAISREWAKTPHRRARRK